MKQKTETNRVEVGGAGIGEVSDEMIAERARKLARADGREAAGAVDLEQAREELMGSSELNNSEIEDAIPEDERAGDGTPATGNGTQAPRLELDDEANLAEEEVEEGIAEADLDSRAQSFRRE